MVDLHCHILPGIDDGSKVIEESILMAKEAYDDGIRTIVATPHHQNGIYNNQKQDVVELVALLNRRIIAEGLGVTILPGQEIHIHDDFVNGLKSGDLLTFNDQNKYVFIELPYDRVPLGTDRMIFDILVAGYIPIIPHPERNKGFQEKPELLYQLVSRGALSQLTASSLLGLFGNNVQSFADEILEHNLAHFIASDSHGIGKRGVKLKQSYDYIQSNYEVSVTEYFKDNATRVINGKDIYVEEPLQFKKKKKIFGLF